MTRTVTVVVGLLVLLLAAPAGAQDGTGTLTKWYLFTVKTGHDVQWEQSGRTRLMRPRSSAHTSSPGVADSGTSYAT